MSGVDVTITAVHPSPFRDPTTGDEFDGQEISFVPPESRIFKRSCIRSARPRLLFRVRLMQKCLKSASLPRPPGPRQRDPGRSSISGESLRLPRLQDPSTGKQETRLPEHPVLIGWKWVVLWMLCLRRILLMNRKPSELETEHVIEREMPSAVPCLLSLQAGRSR